MIVSSKDKFYLCHENIVEKVKVSPWLLAIFQRKHTTFLNTTFFMKKNTVCIPLRLGRYILQQIIIK